VVKFPNKTLERQLILKGYASIIGVDEVGMACLAGPVVVCALAVSPDFYTHRYPRIARMRDSKALRPHQREQFAKQLQNIPGLRWRIAVCGPEVIDRINIYQASRVAMRDAIKGLQQAQDNQNNQIVLVDGNKIIRGLDLPQQAIVKGDRKVWAIAAASILAKVHRDRLMTEYAKDFPGYGFEIHKGYPTSFHRHTLAERGPCPLHRRSFNGVDEK
jgi:ribonuclease HII